MKTKYFIVLLSAIFGLADCKTEEPPVKQDGYEAPAAPTTVNQNNLITVEFYSQMNEETLFKNQDYKAIVNHIEANKTPVAYLFDRSDALLGQTSPVVNMAWQSKLKSFFVQNQSGDAQIQGTGLIVKPLIPVFEGIGVADSLYLAGCTLAVPMDQPVVLTLMTCKLTAGFQFPLMAKSLGDGLKSNKIVVGTIKSELTDDMKIYLKHNLKDFRLSFYSSLQTGKTYKLFFLTPVAFVERGVSELTIGITPMYQCKIEYLN